MIENYAYVILIMGVPVVILAWLSILLISGPDKRK